MPEPLSATASYEWSQSQRRNHILTRDGVEIGRLVFDKGFGSLATGSFGADSWTFKRVGFLHPRLTIRKPGSDTDLGLFTPTWTSGGTVEFAGGRRFAMRSLSFWGSDWAFVNEAGESVVTLHGPRGFLKQGGEAKVTDAGAHLAETPILMMLLWYVRLLANEDAAAATMIVCMG